jgi:formylglycine-generating enzyme required for sulfatase activity
MSCNNRLLKVAWFFLLLGFFGAVSGSAFSQEVLESQGIRFHLIPGGVYFIGSPPNEPGRYADEPTPHQVKLSRFYISEMEITNAQYRRFLQDSGRRPPLYWRDKNLNAPGQPVVGVTWFDAAAFADWLSDDGFRLTASVGSFPPNGFGLHDMAGNAAEWCLDRFFAQADRGPYTDPEARVLKGGSWYSRARDLRCAARRFAAPQNADGFIGFRVVRLPPDS